MHIFMMLLLILTLSSAEELVLDKHYTGPQKLTVSSLGISMGLPSHWEAIAHKHEGLRLFQNESKNSMLLRSKEMDLADVEVYLSRPHYFEDNTKLFPLGRIVTLSSRIYYRSYAINGESSHLVTFYVVLGPQKRAVVMRVLYDIADDSAIKATGMNIIQALSFTPTKQLQSKTQDLETRLKGVHLAYMKRDGAYDNKRELWLCSNKRYLLKEERVVAGGMSRATDQKFGHWSLENKKLILRADDGFEYFIEVKRKDSALILDGIRSYELKNHQCQ